MPILENGDVVESHKQPAPYRSAWDGGVFDYDSLYQGEVKEIIYPEDDNSQGGTAIEYRVMTEVITNGAKTTQEFRCVYQNVFGGIADKFRPTLRADTTDQREKDGIGNGSKVLFLCISGQKHRGIIIAATRDSKDKPDTGQKKLGHHLDFTFNGIAANIDKDGQFTLTYNGKTNIDGSSAASPSKTGSLIQLQENGNITIQDKNAANQILINHAASKIENIADVEWNASANGSSVRIDPDGSILSLANDGSMIFMDARDGSTGIKLVEASGNNITIDEDGIATVDKAGSSFLLSGDGTAQVAATDVVIAGQTIGLSGGSVSVGANADSFMVRGTELQAVLLALTAALTTMANAFTVEAAAGLALTNALIPIIAQINTAILSISNKVK